MSFRGAPRLHGELLKLRIEVSQSTIAKYMVKHRKPPSQTWRTFLENHVKRLVSVDFFVVPTVVSGSCTCSSIWHMNAEGSCIAT